MDLEDAGQAFRFLLRDHDGKFGHVFDTVFTAAGVRIVLTPIRAPRANAIAERFVGGLRRELLDRILIVNQRHAVAVLPSTNSTSTDIARIAPSARQHRCGHFPTHARSETYVSAGVTGSAGCSTNMGRSRSAPQLWAPTRAERHPAPNTGAAVPSLHQNPAWDSRID
jgi:transposase InsO family protein